MDRLSSLLWEIHVQVILRYYIIIVLSRITITVYQLQGKTIIMMFCFPGLRIFVSGILSYLFSCIILLQPHQWVHHKETCSHISSYFVHWNAKLQNLNKGPSMIQLHAVHYKRHFLGWINIKLWENQARSLRVMLVWRHQAVIQLVGSLVSQSIENCLWNIFLNPVATFWKHFGFIWA